MPEVIETTPLDRPISDSIAEQTEERTENSEEKGDASTPEDSSHEKEKKIEWATALRSPSSDVFSPCKDIVAGTKEAQHGCVLLALVERGRTLTGLYGRATVLLLEVSRAYDEFSQSLLKAGQYLKEIGRDASDVQQSLVFWSGSTSKLANSLRTEIGIPFKSLLQAYSDTLQGIREKYLASRRTCVLVRQSTERLAKTYDRSLQAAEQAAREWIANGKTSERNMPVSLKSMCEDLQQQKLRYSKFKEWVEAASDQCREMEKVALESLQLLEDHRMHFTTSALALGVQSLQQTAQEVIHSVKKDIVASIAGAEEERRDISKHVRRRSSSSNSSRYEEGSGVMDAETLGLPEEIGILRDTFRSRVADRAARVQHFRVLAAFIEYISSGFDALSKTLNEISLKNESEMKSLQTVCGELKDRDATHIVELLDGISSYIFVEANAASSCALEVRQLSRTHISNTITYGDKLLTAASNSEEMLYKQLCDSAHRKSRARQLYLLTTDEQAKARERVSSIDYKESEASSPSSVNKHVSRHIATMLSALPNGGEHALSMLNPSTRASLAQNNLEQADEKEVKSRQVLDSASKEVKRLCDKYRDNAERLSAQFDKEDEGGWGEMNTVIGQLGSLIISSCERTLSASSVNTSEISPQLHVDAMNSRAVHYCAEFPDFCGEHHGENPAIASNALTVATPILAKILTSYESNELSENGEEIFVDEGCMESDISMEDSSFNDSSYLGGENDSAVAKSKSRSQDEDDKLLSISMGGGDDTDGQISKWMGLPINGNGMLGVHDSIREKLTFRKRTRRRHRKASGRGATTDLFLSYFWTDKHDIDKPSEGVKPMYFPCSLGDMDKMLDISYGVAFLSETALWFSSWKGKRVSLHMGPEINRLELKAVSWKSSREFIRVLVQNTDGKVTMDFGTHGFLRAQQAFEILTDSVNRAKVKLKVIENEKVLRQISHVEGTSTGDIETKTIFPDKILERMDQVFSRHLNNISVQRFYEIVWEKSLYETWLKETCLDVEVGSWDPTKCQNPSDKEQYDQKRSVQYRVKRKTHLYIGPPVAEVRQTQFCRLENQEKCVMSMTIDFEGIPYSECFFVEVRWVARSSSQNGILVEVGVAVTFRKSTILKSKIRSSAIEEASAVHRNLFDYVRKACIEAGGTEAPTESHATGPDETMRSSERKPALPLTFITIAGFCIAALLLYRFFQPAPQPKMILRDSTLTVEDLKGLEDRVERLQKSVDEILSLLKTLE
ncbi:hypothetical protein FisN_14Lh129 [Fistulifera solaris]|uniref:VASt domain-containing protein n=1 Tax=Fistulifera solaris TaxID=1519565 RepID=A0A1Z5J9P9_FISSO|nr:hypothetical protein FisN_14Lh129 [Fistulifera solaris]|eukprot:GAX10622.1 hypothetical protein FisN_14Lh129 [Fistulifera solaris]